DGGEDGVRGRGGEEGGQEVEGGHLESADSQAAMDDFRKDNWPDSLKPRLTDYNYRLLKTDAHKPEHKPDAEDLGAMKRFAERGDWKEEFRSANEEFVYYGAIRTGDRCLKCHAQPGAEAPVQEGDLMGVVRIKINTGHIKDAVHVNRGLYLMPNAIITALLIVTIAWLIVRYVVVKPVKHLKDVSDAIAAGQINVRSEIHTGDDFEDLSYAFN